MSSAQKTKNNTNIETNTAVTIATELSKPAFAKQYATALAELANQTAKSGTPNNGVNALAWIDDDGNTHYKFIKV